MAYAVTIYLEDVDGQELELEAELALCHDGLGVTLDGVASLEHAGELYTLEDLGCFASRAAAAAREAFLVDYRRIAAEFNRAADEWAQDAHWGGF